MPVTLNEPLSALQRLCEEVQYSELLDEAAALDDPCDRMVSISPVEPLLLGHLWVEDTSINNRTPLSHKTPHFL